MGSPYSKLLKDPEIKSIKPKFSEEELLILAHIYADLSARDYGVISKETFLEYFALTGLWGERIFERFDIKHTGHIGFPAFLNGLASYCKCTEDEKIRLLFSLYDMDKDDYIKKKEFITMLYNYPKQYLKEIIDDEKLEGLNEEKRQRTMTNIELEEIHMKLNLPKQESTKKNAAPSPVSNTKTAKNKNNKDEDFSGLVIAGTLMRIIEEETNDNLHQIYRREIGGRNGNKNPEKDQQDLATVPDTPKKTDVQKSSKKHEYDSRELVKQSTMDNNILPQNEIQSPDKDAQRIASLTEKLRLGARDNDGIDMSMSDVNAKEPQTAKQNSRSNINTMILDQSFMISTTLNVRIKEYASHMFKASDRPQKAGMISFEEFKQWITSHHSLLKVFDDTFHQDIWLRSPLYNLQRSMSDIKKDLAVEGVLFKKGKKSGSWKSRYFELRKQFLMYYDTNRKGPLKGVLFLQGCKITELNDYNKTHKYGFSISHKNDSYMPHLFYCENEAKFKEWMSRLKGFNPSSINDLYIIKEKVGTGKFSTVFRAISKKDEQEYAIKLVKKDQLKASEKESIMLITVNRSETSVMKMLDHPATIKLIDTIEENNDLYIIMEIVKDGDLFDYVMSQGFLEEEESSCIMKKLLLGLHYIHNLGIIHRDLKPENIMISRHADGKVKDVKLIDFGFAKFISSDTVITDVCGTPNYLEFLAPEVVKGNGYDKRADIFSLGVIMYFLLRGLLPFDGPDVGKILYQTFKSEPPMSDDHWQNVSSEGKDLLLKLLEKDPNSRIDLETALKHPWIKNKESLKALNGINRNNQDKTENKEEESPFLK